MIALGAATVVLTLGSAGALKACWPGVEALLEEYDELDELDEHVPPLGEVSFAGDLNLDDVHFTQKRQSLADQFDERQLSGKDAAELLWQARLAGHSSDYLAQLHTAIGQLQRSALLAAAQRLLNAEGGWRCLASESSPGAPWRATK